MGSNHFDDIVNGCPGGQFIEPPTFAWWTIFPCLRWPIISFLLRVPYYLSIIPLGIFLFCLGLAGAIFSCVLLPFTLPIYYCIKKDWLPCNDAEIAPLFPGMCFIGCIGSIVTLALELIWLPIPIVLSLFQFPLFLCSYDPNETSCLSYFACITRGDPNPYWCLPFSLIQSLGATIFRDDD